MNASNFSINICHCHSVYHRSILQEDDGFFVLGLQLAKMPPCPAKLAARISKGKDAPSCDRTITMAKFHSNARAISSTSDSRMCVCVCTRVRSISTNPIGVKKEGKRTIQIGQNSPTPTRSHIDWHKQPTPS